MNRTTQSFPLSFFIGKQEIMAVFQPSWTEYQQATIVIKIMF